MGRVHLEHPNGENNISCVRCWAPIAEENWILQKYKPKHDNVYLVTKCLNIEFG